MSAVFDSLTHIMSGVCACMQVQMKLHQRFCGAHIDADTHNHLMSADDMVAVDIQSSENNKCTAESVELVIMLHYNVAFQSYASPVCVH